MSILETLKAVLCDPEGNVSIRGSSGDKEIIKTALDEIEEVILSTLRIQDLWIGSDEWAKEHEGEAQALFVMKTKLEMIVSHPADISSCQKEVTE